MSRSDARDAVRAFPFMVFFQLKLDLISLQQGVSKACVFHITPVKKHFLAGGCDNKPEPFCLVVKLNRAARHLISPFFSVNLFRKQKPRSRPEQNRGCDT
jgi:hypothetical protein